MAIPLDPQLDPAEFTGPEFVWSEEIGIVAEAVLDRHGRAGGIPRLHPIRRAAVEDELHIRYVLNRKPFDPQAEEVTHDVISKCVKAPKLWHDLYGDDVVIWVREYFWNEFDERGRAGVLLHELLHVEVDHDKNNLLKVSLRKHDVEEFVLAVRYYGDFAGGRRALAKAMAQFDQDGGEPGGQLRSLQDDAAHV